MGVDRSDEPGEINWRAMARAFMDAIFDAEITDEEKQAIFDDVLRKSPGYAVDGDISFESMIIADALRNKDESEL